jgi:hypothetical protein
MTDNEDVSTWPDGQDGRWWTLKDAAETFGTSVKTLRRRIKDGTVVAQRDEDDAQSPWMIREASLIRQFGEPAGLYEEKPVELQPPMAIELKALIEDHRRMLHDLQDAYKAEAIASAKVEHLGERVVEVRADRDEVKGERDELKDERDRLAAEVAALRNRRWWQRSSNI